MNDPWTISTATVISLLAAALAGICVYFVKRILDKVEQLDAQAVRKRELKELEERLTQDRREMNDQVQQKLDDIKEDVRGIYGMLNRGGGR